MLARNQKPDFFTVRFMAAVLFVFIFSLPASAQEFPKFVKLAKVEYQGLSLFTPDEITPMTGLKTGATVALADLEKAAAELTYFGYFKSVRFNYRYQGAQLTATLQLEEDGRLVDCIFDNFIGFSDQELLAAIQKQFPSFKGKVPLNGSIHQMLAAILENFLDRDGTVHRIGVAPILSPMRLQQGTQQYIVFTIENPKASICKISVSGDDPELMLLVENALLQYMKAPYSRVQINTSYRQAITPLMRKHGFWNFDFAAAKSEKINAPDCPSGALLNLSFKTGSKYSWGKVLWSGNANKSTSELDQLFGMQSGEPASLEKIEAGLLNVANGYLQIGFMEYSMRNARPDINETMLSVDYLVNVIEGRQFRMGQFLSFPGIGASLPFDQLKRQWRLKEGDLFNGVYLGEFTEKYFNPWHKKYSPGVALQLKAAPDKTPLIMNVVLMPEIQIKNPGSANVPPAVKKQ